MAGDHQHAAADGDHQAATERKLLEERLRHALAEPRQRRQRPLAFEPGALLREGRDVQSDDAEGRDAGRLSRG